MQICNMLWYLIQSKIKFAFKTKDAFMLFKLYSGFLFLWISKVYVRYKVTLGIWPHFWAASPAWNVCYELYLVECKSNKNGEWIQILSWNDSFSPLDVFVSNKIDSRPLGRFFILTLLNIILTESWISFPLTNIFSPSLWFYFYRISNTAILTSFYLSLSILK